MSRAHQRGIVPLELAIRHRSIHVPRNVRPHAEGNAHDLRTAPRTQRASAKRDASDSQVAATLPRGPRPASERSDASAPADGRAPSCRKSHASTRREQRGRANRQTARRSFDSARYARYAQDDRTRGRPAPHRGAPSGATTLLAPQGAPPRAATSERARSAMRAGPQVAATPPAARNQRASAKRDASAPAGGRAPGCCSGGSRMIPASQRGAAWCARFPRTAPRSVLRYVRGAVRGKMACHGAPQRRP